jgi:hypothetical protein
MNLDVVIPIDDTHPEIGRGVKEDKCTDYLIKLNQEFGCKFVQFIPSNYHRKFSLSENKSWIDYWKQFDWVELAAHGHFHDRVNPSPSCRECEFIELDYKSAKDRIEQSLEEWDKVNHRPKGWRMPGWVASQGAFDAVTEYFDYVAIHGNLNDNIKLNSIRVFKGENPIHNASTLSIDGNNLYFQSHIAGKYNQNNWDEQNYQYFRSVLNALLDQGHILNYKTFSDLC